MDNLPIVEDVEEKNNFIYDIAVKMEILRENKLGEVSVNMRIQLNFYDTTTTLFTSKRSIPSSNASDAQLVILFSAKQTTSTAIIFVARI